MRRARPSAGPSRFIPVSTDTPSSLRNLFVAAAGVAGALIGGIELTIHPHSVGWAERIAAATIVCFLIGISRSWELSGGPETGLSHELRERMRTPD